MRSDTTFRVLAGSTSLLSLLVCIGAAVAAFTGAVTAETFRWIFLVASIAWFVCATAWSSVRKER